MLPAVALALALGVAGCGGSGEAAKASGPERTITDATGTKVKVSEHPKRVVTLSELDLDVALSLDVKPVGAISGRGQKTPSRYLAKRAAGIPIVGSVTGPQMQKVIEQRPDVILAGQVRDAQVLSQLRKVAPTVVTFKLGEDWKSALKRTAGALNRGGKAKRVLAHYDRRVKDVKAKLGDNADAEVSVVRWSPQNPSIIKQGLFASDVLKDLGLRRPPSQAKQGPPHGVPVSLENIDRLDGDWMFLGTLTEDGPDVRNLKKVEKTAAFKDLTAVQKGHVVAVDGSQWTSLGGPQAALGVLDDVRKALASKK